VRNRQRTAQVRRLPSGKLPLCEEPADQAVVIVSAGLSNAPLAVLARWLGRVPITTGTVRAMAAAAIVGDRRIGLSRFVRDVRVVRAPAIQQVQSVTQQGHEPEQRQG
jgi:hypothetical protein